MTQVTEGNIPSKESALSKFLASNRRISGAAALILTLISVPFMISLLPVENSAGALGAMAIYFVVMIVVALILRPFVMLGRKLLERGRKAGG